jgi:hypothetical protein
LGALLTRTGFFNGFPTAERFTMVSEPFIALKFKSVSWSNGRHNASLPHSFHLTQSNHRRILLHEFFLLDGPPAQGFIFPVISSLPSGATGMKHRRRDGHLCCKEDCSGPFVRRAAAASGGRRCGVPLG